MQTSIKALISITGASLVTALSAANALAASPSLNFDISNSNSLSAQFPVKVVGSSDSNPASDTLFHTRYLSVTAGTPNTTVVGISMFIKNSTPDGPDGSQCSTLTLNTMTTNELGYNGTNINSGACKALMPGYFAQMGTNYGQLLTYANNNRFAGAYTGDFSFTMAPPNIVTNPVTKWTCPNVTLVAVDQYDYINKTNEEHPTWAIVTNIPGLTNNQWVGGAYDFMGVPQNSATTISCSSDTGQTSNWTVKADSSHYLTDEDPNFGAWAKVTWSNSHFILTPAGK